MDNQTIVFGASGLSLQVGGGSQSLAKMEGIAEA
ncbi:MAG: hypothetical protein ACI89X_000624 [Planctomycetota bacterium]|jgi:hypothetical protein